MTTLASPSQGPTEYLSMWLVDMRAGQQGPPHFYDAEQIWHLLEGDVDIAVDGDPVALSPGDTLILPAETAPGVGAPRRPSGRVRPRQRGGGCSWRGSITRSSTVD